MNRQVFRFIIASFMALAVATPAWTMTLKVVDHTLFATGPVVGEDYGRFKDALSPQIDTVVFVNSTGGDLWAGLQVSRLIAARPLRTVTAGFCSSSCSLLFIAGKERLFADNFVPGRTFVGIHGPHNTETKALLTGGAAAQMFALYKSRMGERFNEKVMNSALYEMKDAGSLTRVFDMGRKPARVTYFCPSGATPRAQCTDLPGADAMALGVVTSPGLLHLSLPPEMRSPPQLWGQQLDDPLTDLPARIDALTSAQCATDTCREVFHRFMEGAENRALATPLEGTGLGTSIGRDTESLAGMGAVYNCNNVAGRPVRLCEVRIVNDIDTASYYAAARAAHAKALASLQIPSERFYANEEFGFASPEVKVHTADFAGLTPLVIPGVKTVGTQDLVSLLKSDQPPIVLDVMGNQATIPTARTIFAGWQAFDDPQKEKAFQDRFAGLLRLLAPDLSKPIVIVGTSRNSWQPVNAVLRAQGLGYTDVRWYRGGMEAWTAAGLVTVLPIVQAAAN